jgi:EAL domain-containing protein (putative c-di-GMP-specific phosphodiesterase class I)
VQTAERLIDALGVPLALPGAMLGVNLSARQLTDHGLVDQVAATLTATGLPAERLLLEITEPPARSVIGR